MRWLLIFALALMLSACTSTKYVPVESVRTEYRDREIEKLVSDTVRDTRLVWVKGDTIREIRNREHLRLVSVHDTCFVEHTDTIRVPYPVERKLSRWEQAKMDFGGMAIGATVLLVVFVIAWLIKRYARHA